MQSMSACVFAKKKKSICVAQLIGRTCTIIDNKLCWLFTYFLSLPPTHDHKQPRDRGPRPLLFSVWSAYWSVLSMAWLSTIASVKIPFI